MQITLKRIFVRLYTVIGVENNRRPIKKNIQNSKYTHGNKLGNTCNNVTTNFGLYISFFVKIMKNVLTTCQNL